jgi:hypothetical protein
MGVGNWLIMCTAVTKASTQYLLERDECAKRVKPGSRTCLRFLSARLFCCDVKGHDFLWVIPCLARND